MPITVQASRRDIDLSVFSTVLASLEVLCCTSEQLCLLDGNPVHVREGFN